MRNESLKELFHRIKRPTLSKEQAESKVCQEVFVAKIGSDPVLSKRICFKGGLILDRLAKGQRGYTKDIDFDLIQYPLSEEGLRSFFERVSGLPPYENVSISIERIEELRHKNYQGKRLFLSFYDGESKFALTVDVGVYLPILKRNHSYGYEVAFGGTSTLQVNPIERTIAEKLSVFAIYGTDNIRDKDLFDAYWLIKRFRHDQKLVGRMLFEILVKRGHYFKSLARAVEEIETTLSDESYRETLGKSRKNWVDVEISEIIQSIDDYLRPFATP